MKIKRLFLAVLLAIMMPRLAFATYHADTLTASDSTNGLSRMLSVSDYVEMYNDVLINTVPPGEGLLDAPDKAYIEAAKTLLVSHIPNFSTATINDAAIYSTDPYGRFCVWFDVTESAAFNTFTRGSYYVFVQALKADDRISYLDNNAVLAGDDPASIQRYASVNEFGVNPAEKAVKGYIQSADMYTQEASVRISPDEVYSPYEYNGRGYSLTLYIGPSEGQLAGMKLSIGEEQLSSFPMAERNIFINRCLASALATMQGEAETEHALAVIGQLFDTTRLTPSGNTIYEDEMLYGCFSQDSILSFVAMPVQESVYAEQTYWWVHQGNAYLVAQGESSLRSLAYDDAIWYYEEAGLTASTSKDLAHAYYEKAEGLLGAKQYDQAIAGFEKAGDYSDATVRIAEAYYLKGDADYEAGNILLAMESFAKAGRYEDAEQRVLSSAYWLGEDALANGDYDTAEAYFSQSAGYLDADMRAEQINFERAEKLAQVGDNAKAASYYARATGYLSSLGNDALKDQDYDAAIAYYEKAGFNATSLPELAKAYYGLGSGYLAAGQYDSAIAAFLSAGDFENVADRLAETYYAKGKALFASGNIAGAKECFALADGFEDADQQYNACCYALGEEALAAKQYDKADAYFLEISGYQDADERLIQSYYERAEQLMLTGDKTAAVSYYERAAGYLDANDKVAAVRYEKADKAFANGDYETASQLFAQAGDYADSKERLQQIEGIAYEQDYARALNECNAYFANPLYGTEYPASTHDALLAMNGYSESAQLAAKLQAVKRMMDIVDQARQLTGIGLKAREIATESDLICLELSETGSTTYTLEGFVDGSKYSVKSSWLTFCDNEKLANQFALFSLMITGGTQEGSVIQQLDNAKWAQVDNHMEATIFADGYKLVFYYIEKNGFIAEFAIVAEKNDY